MSSFIKLSGDSSVRVSNSTFKTIMTILEEHARANRLASQIMEANRIARPIGMLHLDSISDDEFAYFRSIVLSLRENYESITANWNSPNQFPVDLDAIVEAANKRMESNG